jgi:hypothetical protein
MNEVYPRLDSKLPSVVVSNRLDGPLELVAKRLGEELLDWHLELGAEDNRETRIDVVLFKLVSIQLMYGR